MTREVNSEMIGSAWIQPLFLFGNRSPQEEGFLMHWHDPRWILVAWLVVAVASALRFWRITGPFRARLRSQQRLAALNPDKARQSLERSWRKRDATNPH